MNELAASTELAASEPSRGDSWTTLAVGDLQVHCREDFAEALRATYGNHEWVYDALLRCPRTSLLRGRRPVAAGELDGRQVVVKRIYHGGLFAFVGRDAFLTADRARSHVELANYLHDHGVPTAPVIFASWRRRRGLVRCEVGFERIEGALDGDRYFFGGKNPPESWESRAAEIGVLVARMHRIHFLHADLNLMNFLIAKDGETYILDLDKSPKSIRPRSGRELARNLERLERSIRKQGRHHVSTVVDGIIGKIRASYRAALAIAQILAGSELAFLLAELLPTVETLPTV